MLLPKFHYFYPSMKFVRFPTPSARLQAYSFARLLGVLLFLLAATSGSALAKVQHFPTASKLAAEERKAAKIDVEDSLQFIPHIYVSGTITSTAPLDLHSLFLPDDPRK